jgi:hypothetical protein
MPVEARMGETTFTISLFQKTMPMCCRSRVVVQKAAGTSIGDKVSMILEIKGH